MKPKKQPNGAKKLPKPQIGYTSSVGQMIYIRGTMPNCANVLCLPLPTKRAALAKLKWEALSYPEKVEAAAKVIYEAGRGSGEDWSKQSTFMKQASYIEARAILALTGEPSPNT